MKTFVVLAVVLAVANAALQKYSVKGRLMCGDKAANGIQVKLVDKDVGSDDVLGNVRTDGQGNFQVEGTASGGVTGIDPTLKIYHKCEGGVNPCARRWKMRMPNNYIVNANQASKWFDMGVLNLQVSLEHSEDRNCI